MTNSNTRPTPCENPTGGNAGRDPGRSHLPTRLVTPGSIYEDENGRKWLCLDGVQFTVKFEIFDKENPYKTIRTGETRYGLDGRHMYLLWTDQLEDALTLCLRYKWDPPLHQIFEKMNNIDIANNANVPWYAARAFSVTKKPRHFVRTANLPIKIDIAKTKNWHIWSKRFKANGTRSHDTIYRYSIYAHHEYQPPRD